jgi:hypothetical protein
MNSLIYSNYSDLDSDHKLISISPSSCAHALHPQHLTRSTSLTHSQHLRPFSTDTSSTCCLAFDMLKSLSAQFGFNKNSTTPADQAQIDALVREIARLKATIAGIGTPPDSFSKKQSFANVGAQNGSFNNKTLAIGDDNQDSFARKFRRAGVATANTIQFGEVLPAMKPKTAQMISSAQALLRQAVLTSPLFAGVLKSVESIVHRFKPYDYVSGETVVGEDSHPCFVVVEHGTFFQFTSGVENRTYNEVDTFGAKRII